MHECWQRDPERRPTFEDLVLSLTAIINPKKANHEIHLRRSQHGQRQAALESGPLADFAAEDLLIDRSNLQLAEDLGKGKISLFIEVTYTLHIRGRKFKIKF